MNPNITQNFNTVVQKGSQSAPAAALLLIHLNVADCLAETRGNVFAQLLVNHMIEYPDLSKSSVTWIVCCSLMMHVMLRDHF